MDGDPNTSDINAELDERWMARCARKYEWLRHNMDVMVDAYGADKLREMKVDYFDTCVYLQMEKQGWTVT